jgi:glyoxylase-like metal-dependent hydrolase (beta-lactamase superfamily II)
VTSGFMPDGGSARADFPGGDARTLYRSIKRVLSLPDETRLFMCHDYGPNGRSGKRPSGTRACTTFTLATALAKRLPESAAERLVARRPRPQPHNPITSPAKRICMGIRDHGLG